MNGSIRATLGKHYYSALRYMQWFLSSPQYARRLSDSSLPYKVYSHRSPLMRPLRNVDLWMQRNKVRNLELALKRLNGLIVEPGETFSYWRLIGRPTRKKGYVDGMVLMHGRVGTGVGGGLCQLSNLIYWMALHTSLKVTERFRHEYDVFPDENRTVPFGSGATCFYNYIDLQLYNGTDRPYQLVLFLKDGDLVGEWRSSEKQDYRYRVYQKDHWITHEYGRGYVRHNSLYREVYNPDNQLIGDEFVAENHALMMYRPFLAEGASQED